MLLDVTIYSATLSRFATHFLTIGWSPKSFTVCIPKRHRETSDARVFVQGVFDHKEQTARRVQSVPQPQHRREANLEGWGSSPLLVVNN